MKVEKPLCTIERLVPIKKSESHVDELRYFPFFFVYNLMFLFFCVKDVFPHGFNIMEVSFVLVYVIIINLSPVITHFDTSTILSVICWTSYLLFSELNVIKLIQDGIKDRVTLI